MTVDLGCKYVENIAGDFSWSMMNTKDFIASLNCTLKIENGKLVFFQWSKYHVRFLNEGSLIFFNDKNI